MRGTFEEGLYVSLRLQAYSTSAGGDDKPSAPRTQVAMAHNGEAACPVS
jgi:hypothetical protein